jgi:hypothetical protein
MKRTLFVFLAVILPFFIFTACNKDKGTSGTVNLSITDAPVDSDGITGVFITVLEIQYHTHENEWKVFEDYEGPKSFNLLDLQRGESELLGSFEMEAGTYTQIRFMLDAPVFGTGQHSNPGCYLEFSDGSQINLFVPSGAQTGYKAVGAFTVPINGSVDVTADFDVRKSVVKAGASGKYLLKPTIRLIVDNQSGQIAGEVTNIPEQSNIVIYAYTGDTYDESEAEEPAEEEVRFPNAISSDMVDENGLYLLAYLAPGTYDLVIVSTDGGDITEVLGVVENILVESRETTIVDIDIEDLQNI